MKFNRIALIANIDARMAAIDKATEEANAKRAESYADAKVEWLASDHPEALKGAANHILRQLRRGRTVTPEDVAAITARGYSSTSHTFNETEPKPAEPRYGQMPALRAFLETVEDDEVTSSGLRDVGFRNIANILRSAA